MFKELSHTFKTYEQQRPYLIHKQNKNNLVKQIPVHFYTEKATIKLNTFLSLFHANRHLTSVLQHTSKS